MSAPVVMTNALPGPDGWRHGGSAAHHYFVGGATICNVRWIDMPIEFIERMAAEQDEEDARAGRDPEFWRCGSCRRSARSRGLS